MTTSTSPLAAKLPSRSPHLPPPVHRRWRGVAFAFALAAAAIGAGALALYVVDAPLPIGPEPAGLAAALPPASPPPGLAFSVLQTAVSNGAAEALIVGRGRWTVHRHPSQSAVLIRHPRGLMLYDTGLGRQVDAQFAANDPFHRQAFGYDRRGFQPAADQLAKAGWSPQAVRLIVPSHMHWDHVSGLPDFADAQVWVTPQEREHAERGRAPGFLRSQFAGVRHWRELRFEGPPMLGFAASHDMFGDGSVVLLPLGGHTAGQVGLLLRLPSGRRYLFTGDVTWSLEGVQRAADRSWLLRRLLPLDHDEHDNQAAIVHLHQIARRHPDITIVPAHDENVLRALPRFPELRG